MVIMVEQNESPRFSTHEEVWGEISKDWSPETWAQYWELKAAFARAREIEQIAQVVKEARAARKWSQRRLANESGVQQNEICKIEKAKANPTMETQIKLFSVLGIRVKYEFEAAPQEVVAA